jgi:hypothetical protein
MTFVEAVMLHNTFSRYGAPMRRFGHNFQWPNKSLKPTALGAGRPAVAIPTTSRLNFLL